MDDLLLRRRMMMMQGSTPPPPPHVLPDEYLQLAALQWGSTAAGFITPIYDDGSYGDIGYTIDLMPTGSQGNYVSALLGSNIWGIRNVDSNYRLSLGGNQYVTLARANNTRYEIVADSGTGDITVNGSVLGNVNRVRNFRNYIVIGGYRQGSTLNAVARNIRIYSYILTNASGSYICECTPCERIADGELGFWDYVSRTFITNSAGGSVTPIYV